MEVKAIPDRAEEDVTAKGCRVSGGVAGPGCPRMDSYYTDLATPQICGGHPAEDAEAAAAEAAAAAAAAA